MKGDPRKKTGELAARLRASHADRLRSVLLYGSVARGEAIAGVSNVNVLVLLDRVTTDDLRTLGPLTRDWTKAGDPPPLLLGWDEWRAAADAFAIELADMVDAHEVVHGDDPLAGLVIEPAALRLQTERELRGKLVALREGLLATASAPKEQGALLAAALPSFATYMRAIVRLAGEPAPQKTPDVIERACALVGADAAPYQEVWRARASGKPPRVGADAPLVAGYYHGAERLVKHVDAIPQETT